MIARVVLVCSVACIGAGFCAMHAAAAAGSGPVEVARFEVLREPVRLPDGSILAVGIRLRNGIQEVDARVSRDEGTSWSAPRPLFRLPREAGGFGFYETFVDRRGEIHLFLLCDGNTGAALPVKDKPATQVLDIWQVRSTASATAWESPRRIWAGRAGDLLSAIQLPGGRIILPISFQTDRSWSQRDPGFPEFTNIGRFSSSVLYSDDDGATWRQSPSILTTPTPAIGSIGGVEPAVISLKDGRVWMLIRTEMGRFYESFSHDGAAWLAPRPTAIVSSESPAGLVRLKDGRLLLLVNNAERFPYAFGGRHVLHAAISEDEGATWHGYREVVRDPLRNQPPPTHGDFGAAYPFPVLTASGKVLFTLGVASGTRSQWPEGLDGPPHDEQRSALRFDPAWLDETTQRTDFSLGLDDWSTFGTKGADPIPHPDKTGAQVLRLFKPDTQWPSGAVWNFPAGPEGSMHLRVLLKAGSAGVLLGLIDHFSVPWDQEDRFHNIFNFDLQPGPGLEAGRWHDVELDWNCDKGECRVKIDGHARPILSRKREPQSHGICYLRLRSAAPDVDTAGALFESVSVKVSPRRTR